MASVAMVMTSLCNTAKLYCTQVLYESSSEDDKEEEEESRVRSSSGVVDVEDMGRVVVKLKEARVRRSKEEAAARKNGLQSSEPREMVTPLLRKNLTKQGETAPA